jgi:hypothetical protein
MRNVQQEGSVGQHPSLDSAAASVLNGSATARKSVTFSTGPLDIRTLDTNDEHCSKLPLWSPPPPVILKSHPRGSGSSAPPGKTSPIDLHRPPTTSPLVVPKKRSRNDFALMIDDPVDDGAQLRSQRSTPRPVAETVHTPPRSSSTSVPSPRVVLLPRRRLQLTLDDSSPICLSPPEAKCNERVPPVSRLLTRRTGTLSLILDDPVTSPNSSSQQRTTLPDEPHAIDSQRSRKMMPLARRDLNTRAVEVAKQTKQLVLPSALSGGSTGVEQRAHKAEWPGAIADSSAGSQLLSAMVAARRALARSSIVLAGGETEYLDS